MSRVVLSENEENELYVLLKPREARLGEDLSELLRRIEGSLFDRMTIEEIEHLAARFQPDR